MKSILVLCGDNRIIDGGPFLTMLYADGKMTAEKVIEGVFPEEYDRIIYVITEEFEKKFDVSAALRRRMGNIYPIEIVRLKGKTCGPAETAYRAILQADVSGELAIRDSHNFIRLACKASGNYIVGLDLSQYEHTIDNLRSKSFIRLNEQRKVLDIVEKKFCSDIISCGLYGFSNAADFAMAYEKLHGSMYSIEKLYVSHIIAYLIGYLNKVFHVVDAAYFEDWATSSSWARVQNWHATYFIDYDTVCGGNVPIDKQVLHKLQRASRNGGFIVLFTSATDLDTGGLKNYFEQNQIMVGGFIKGCSFSNVQKIVSSRKQLESLILEDI